MAERLTGFDYCFTRCMEPGADKQEIREDLEEQGKLVILQKPIGRVTFDQFNDEGGTHDTSTND